MICFLINSIVLHNFNKNRNSYFLTMSNLSVNNIKFNIAGLYKPLFNIPQSLWLMSPELTTPGQDTLFIDFAAKRFFAQSRLIAQLDLTFKPRFINCLLSCDSIVTLWITIYKLSTQRKFQPEKTLHNILESILPILLLLNAFHCKMKKPDEEILQAVVVVLLSALALAQGNSVLPSV